MCSILIVCIFIFIYCMPFLPYFLFLTSFYILHSFYVCLFPQHPHILTLSLYTSYKTSECHGALHNYTLNMRQFSLGNRRNQERFGVAVARVADSKYT